MPTCSAIAADRRVTSGGAGRWTSCWTVAELLGSDRGACSLPTTDRAPEAEVCRPGRQGRDRGGEGLITGGAGILTPTEAFVRLTGGLLEGAGTRRHTGIGRS